MALPDGTTCETIIEDKLRRMVAYCDAYQTFVSADDYTAALATVHVDAFDDPDDVEEYTATEFAALFAQALVWVAEDEGISWTLDRAYGYSEVGTAHLRLRRAVPVADLGDREKASRDFKNLAGAVAQDLRDQAGEADKMKIGDMRRIGPYMSADDESEPYPWFEVEYVFDWI